MTKNLQSSELLFNLLKKEIDSSLKEYTKYMYDIKLKNDISEAYRLAFEGGVIWAIKNRDLYDNRI